MKSTRSSKAKADKALEKALAAVRENTAALKSAHRNIRREDERIREAHYFLKDATTDTDKKTAFRLLQKHRANRTRIVVDRDEIFLAQQPAVYETLYKCIETCRKIIGNRKEINPGLPFVTAVRVWANASLYKKQYSAEWASAYGKRDSENDFWESVDTDWINVVAHEKKAEKDMNKAREDAREARERGTEA